jgi:rhodanese-related sulfurtransferase
VLEQKSELSCGTLFQSEKERGMKTMSHEELKQKLDRKENFRLVNALSEWAYQAKHIPGSMHFATIREAIQSLNKDDEIVVYCSDENCIASKALGQLLERNGNTHVLHYSGGLQDWEQAGYPLEGEWVK